MAAPKKGSREIEVDGTAYHWRIRRKATYGQSDYGHGTLHVSIQLAEAPGVVLVIKTDRPHPADWGTKKVIPVMPGDVSEWVRQALELGWTPSVKGRQLSLELRGEVLGRVTRG